MNLNDINYINERLKVLKGHKIKLEYDDKVLLEKVDPTAEELVLALGNAVNFAKGRAEAIKKLKVFLQKNYPNCQAFDTNNIAGDKMNLVYVDGNIEVWYCEYWNYLEIFGLTDMEYEDLIKKGTMSQLKTFRVDKE